MSLSLLFCTYTMTPTEPHYVFEKKIAQAGGKPKLFRFRFIFFLECNDFGHSATEPLGPFILKTGTKMEHLT